MPESESENFRALGYLIGATRNFLEFPHHQIRHMLLAHLRLKETSNVKARRPLAVLAATAITGFGLTALATPASANTTVTLTGSDLSPDSVSGTSFDVTNNSGGLARFYALTGASDVIELNGTPCAVDGDCSVPDDQTVTVTILPGAQQQSVEFLFAVQTGLSVTYSGTPPNPDPSPLIAESGGPGIHIQQFPRPTLGTCDEAQPEGLNWGGASSGGWGESWAQWMHEGQGGAVCTRTLAYNTSTGTWQVQ